MIPILQQTGQRSHSTITGTEGVGFGETEGRLDNKTFSGFPHGTGVESGFSFRAVALAGSIFTGATGSIVFWTSERVWIRGESSCFPKGWWAKLFPREDDSLTL